MARITDPQLKQLIRSSTKAAGQDGSTLADLAIQDPKQLEASYAAWRKAGEAGPFEDIGRWAESFERLWEDRLDNLGEYLNSIAHEE